MGEILKLKDVCEINGGYAFKSTQYKAEGTPLIRIGDISEKIVEISDGSVYIDDDINKYDKFIIKKGDILIALSGATTGKFGIYNYDEVALLNQRVARISPNELVDNSYLFHYMNKLKDIIYSKALGCAQPNISPSEISELDIYIPSLEIQKKIAEVLDKAQELIDKRKEQIKAMDELVKSRFIEMFGDPITNPKGWNTAKLGDICSISRGGSPRPIDEFLGGPIPWIKISDATKGDDIYIYKTKEGIIEDGVKKSRLIKKGGLIFANCGVSLGFARILKIDGCIHDGWLAFEDFEKSLDKIFFLKSLNYCTEYFRKTAPDGTQPNLNTSIMRVYVQILPPMELQQEFSKFIEQVDKLKFQMETSLKELEDNFNSLMQKAFKGELF